LRQFRDCRKFDGTYDSVKQDTRTSHNTWCVEECYNHTLNQNVIKRVENITDIPDTNSEYWQFLQYEVGQFYAVSAMMFSFYQSSLQRNQYSDTPRCFSHSKEHHDYIPFHLERSQGVRIITVFLYLNDVEEGGGTHFTKLGITVQPKRGRVVIWPSVYDEDPNKRDPRTHHEALPVKKGIKYGGTYLQKMDLSPFQTITYIEFHPCFFGLQPQQTLGFTNDRSKSHTQMDVANANLTARTKIVAEFRSSNDLMHHYYSHVTFYSFPNVPTIGYPFLTSNVWIQSSKTLRCFSSKSSTLVFCISSGAKLILAKAREMSRPANLLYPPPAPAMAKKSMWVI
jgi:2OG-Fe(II) oxygenase superfamily